VRLSWRWARFGAGYNDAAPARKGQLLRLQVEDRCVPAYHISRHAPTWGWVMQSCWGFYTSFPMPERGADPSLEDDAQSIDVQLQRREAFGFNAGLPLDEDAFARLVVAQGYLVDEEQGISAEEAAAGDWAIGPEAVGAEVNALADLIDVPFRRRGAPGVVHRLFSRASIRAHMQEVGLGVIAAKDPNDSSDEEGFEPLYDDGEQEGDDEEQDELSE